MVTVLGECLRSDIYTWLRMLNPLREQISSLPACIQTAPAPAPVHQMHPLICTGFSTTKSLRLTMRQSWYIRCAVP